MSGDTGSGTLRPILDDAEQLLDRADRAPEPTELVITPERLHRRNLKRRLAERATPRSSYRLADAPTIAQQLLATVDRSPRSVDRVDRLKHVEVILSEPSDATDRLRAAFGSELQAHAEAVEAAHRRVAGMTAWEPDRLNALDATAANLLTVAARDTADIAAGVQALEQGLVERVGTTHSREALLSTAASLVDDEPELWREAFPAVERLSLAGISAVDAPLLDLLVTAADAGVDVRLYLRPGTGPAIADRLSDRLTAGSTLEPRKSGEFEPPAVPTSEIVADTPEAEGRLAAAMVASLLRAGVSPSDVLVVARDAAEYERRLGRAANRHGFSLAVWAQLPVEQTLPYQLFDATCELLGTDEPTLEALLAPLEFRWVPPSTAEAAESSWPLSSARVAALRSGLADEADAPRSLAEWNDLADAVTGDHSPLHAYLDWVDAQPSTPEPAALHDTFEPVLEAYRERVLPRTFAADNPDLDRTAQLARAIVRVEELLVDTRAKYEEWLAAGDVPRSWLAVADLAERVVAARPGRREHGNAAAVDVVDATDAWLKQVPHVVAVGLVDGVWPRRPESVFPSAFRSAVVAGDKAAARRLAVPGRWTAARETDHLASAVGAATEQVVCSRYRRDREGTLQERSPLLSTLSPQRVDESAVQSLLTAGRLPEALAPADGGGA
jgi:ATP-dependent helicase/nuclease subunit B